MTVLWSDLHSTAKRKVPRVMTELQITQWTAGTSRAQPSWARPVEMPQCLSVSETGDLLPRTVPTDTKGDTPDACDNTGVGKIRGNPKC